MTPVALLALTQNHFNETGEMKSLISKSKSAHHPKPTSLSSPLRQPGDGVWGAAHRLADGN